MNEINPFLMKTRQGKKITNLMLALLLLVAGGEIKAQRKLKFNADGCFKIVQFTDTHINLAKGKSEVCFELMEEVIREERPDLIVFTGDVVTEVKPQAAWLRLVEVMKTSGCPWTVVFGNHDHEQGASREELFKIVTTAPNCLMQQGKVKGVGNYQLNIAESVSKHPAAVLYFIDSHGNCEHPDIGGYQWIDFSQIDWLRQQDAKHSLPALAFFHIPLPEYNEALKGKIVGEKGETVCAPKLNSGLFTVLKEGGNVMGTFVGHDHENDFMGVYHNIALAYGRVSAGKNAYGKLAPGVRVVVLTEGKRAFHTYVRLKGGVIKDRCHYPDAFTGNK